ncbi:mitochondrial mRNA pseudouridine synthase RPUSD3 isoform X1 [Antechinus flavipes]|uniref:mitochondrial mRNA pseudouridine synthase RPUSD3 isoform X1 n=1 Tax=Antechinus flavipes TaxID=38775 RepID=UPI00223604E5|nr:mitochondrial mRNA pseudouridine synthase RPUSD3 isoform X1 [Antechinus flavipes]XP_051837802.1 mitochondrial mRNA pseudouridine synthase RPUSD3 isoform X1 [Antechinus flavipes]
MWGRVSCRCRLLCGGTWPGTGVRAQSETQKSETWYQMYLKGAKKKGDLHNQLFPGMLKPETLSHEELAERMKTAVLYHHGPLVALNKPQGLAVTGKPGELTLLSVLPEVGQYLGFRQELQIVRAPGKESSGLVLLSSSPQLTKTFQNFFIHSRRSQKPTVTYWAITVGVPATTKGEIQVALKLDHVRGMDPVVPVKAPSRQALREGVKKTLTHFFVEDSTSDCALIKLQPLTAFPSQLLVHMVLQLCPVLGDHVYSGRVGSVLDESFLLPLEAVIPQTQVLNEQLLHRLQITSNEVALLPLHLHLHEILLPQTSVAPTVLIAPLPPFFSQTMWNLGLQMSGKPRNN